MVLCVFGGTVQKIKFSDQSKEKNTENCIKNFLKIVFNLKCLKSIREAGNGERKRFCIYPALPDEMKPCLTLEVCLGVVHIQLPEGPQWS